MTSLINEFCDLIQKDIELVGDILEFGTGSGDSTRTISTRTIGKKIITFDGFVGLPKTEKGIPKETGWDEGNLKFDYNNTILKLSKYEKVKIYKCMSWELTEPSDYGIDEVSSVNFDFDLYEGTLDALRFVQKCKWEKILFRFDDWGAYHFQVAEEVDKHEKAAFYDWINETNYSFRELKNYTNLSSGLQTIIEVKRK
jgi:hypothetical protein